MVPYLTSVWEAKSSAESIGVTRRSTVRKAAMFAVYEEIKIKVKNHQTLPTIRPDIDLQIDDMMSWIVQYDELDMVRWIR